MRWREEAAGMCGLGRNSEALRGSGGEKEAEMQWGDI